MTVGISIGKNNILDYGPRWHKLNRATCSHDIELTPHFKTL